VKNLSIILWLVLAVATCYGMKKEPISVEKLVEAIKKNPSQAIPLLDNKPPMFQILKHLVTLYEKDSVSAQIVASFLMVSERLKLKKEKPADPTAGECPLCNEPNSFGTYKWIAVLPCGHYCCKDCVERIRNVTDQEGADCIPLRKKCPEDRREFLKPAFEFKVNTRMFKVYAIKSFIDACQNGNLQQVQAIFPYVNVNDANEGGETGLMWAALDGRKNVVEYLLSQGADPNKCEQNGRSALRYANKGVENKYASEKNQAEIINMMITRSKIPVSKDIINDALASAARSNQREIITLLFQKGAEIAGAFQKLAQRFGEQSNWEQDRLRKAANFLLNVRNVLNKEAVQDPESCCICMNDFGSEKAKEVVVLPCGHYLCVKCFNELKPRICPSCRVPCPTFAFSFQFKPDINALIAAPKLIKLIIQRAQKNVAEAVYQNPIRQDVHVLPEKEVKTQLAEVIAQEQENIPVRPLLEKIPEDREENVPAQPVVAEWSCPVCTFSNRPDTHVCEMCNAPRPPVLQPNEWSCSKCTYANPKASDVCEMCKTAQPR
jgi:hypothetical protein